MKRSVRPRKKAGLSESVHHHLNMYALAAGAAGVGVLALAQPSEGKIVYTQTNIELSPQKGVVSYNLDLNHDGITDFTLFDHVGSCPFGVWDGFVWESAPAGNRAEGGANPAALFYGNRIGRSQSFGVAGTMAVRECQSSYRGNWVNVTDRYLGLKFKIHGKTHFGWARLSVRWGFVRPHSRFIVNLTGYAFETIPGRSIKAGHTHGKVDDSTNEEFAPGASVMRPLATPQPASLGMLALGAQGVPLWRRKESALEGEFRGGL